MGRRLHLRAVVNVARGEYIKWITNPRLVTALMLLVFIRAFAVSPMLTHAAKFGAPLNLVEPFLAVCNSGLLALFRPVVFILLMCDFPVMGHSTLLTVSRCGKLNWFLGQMLFALWCILSYIGAMLLGCVLMSHGSFGTVWSDTASKYAARFPDSANDLVSQLLPPNLYNQLPLGAALLHSVLLMLLSLVVTVLTLCLFKMLCLRTAGIFTVIAVCAFGAVTCALKVRAQWLFPTANSIVWLHFQELFRRQNVPVYVSYLYFGICILILFIADLTALKRLQFQNIEQEGD